MRLVSAFWKWEMDPESMKPYGAALLDYYRGKRLASVTSIRDDGLKEEMPAGRFFREPLEYDLERVALDLCRGYVLDVGAGTGIHALYLQQAGFRVCAIDLSSEAVTIMRQRGVIDARQLDVMLLENEDFDSVLMMGHSIGLVETIDALGVFLKHALKLVRPGGQILLTSMDVRATDNADGPQYQQGNVKAGRYFGEVRLRFEYGGISGPPFGWLHVDAETLGGYASKTGWDCKVIQQKPDGNYLARLSRSPG